MYVALLGLLMLFAAPLSAQTIRMDPSWCWKCPDSQLHLAAGAGLDVAAHMILRESRTWQRLLIITVAATAYELGQGEGDGRVGPGYGFGPKDLILGVGGAIGTEIVWALLRKT